VSSLSGQDTQLRRLSFLKQVSLFKYLDDEALTTLAHDFRLRDYDQDQIIFHQGDHSRELYLVRKGKVRIYKISPSGNETSIQIFSTHDIFGEFAIIDGRPRSATAKAIGVCQLLEMRVDQFWQHMEERPNLALGMTHLLVEKMRWTAAYAEAVAQYDAAGRLLHILLLYNDKFGTVVEAGKRYVLDLGLNQADLASLVGVRREWINQLLQRWRKRGLIDYKAGKITILDLPRVEAERDSRIEATKGEW
jgi:CRP/FNR family transcriptional regulator/CRP/FNR family cyclic AMP-dependent transcriptional regulator